MADINDQQISDLISALTKQTGAINKMVQKGGAKKDGYKSRSSALDKIESDLKKSGDNRVAIDRKIYNAAKNVDISLDGLSHSLIKFGGLGIVVGEVIKWGKEATSSFRDLSNVGLSFGGSMARMQEAAFAAGLPLRDFASALAENSAVISRVGVKGFSDVQKQFRGLAEKSGMYGMSMDDLIKFQGDYMETLRLSGSLERAGSMRQARAINDLAVSVSAISGITNKSRKEIMEATKNALRDTTVSAAMQLNAQRGMSSYNEALTKAVTDLAGQTGVAGDLLSKGLADTFSHFGQSQLTDLGKAFIEAGVGSATSVLDEANRRIQAGEDGSRVAMDVVNTLKDQLDDPNILRSLQLQASVGNQAASQILDMSRNMKKYSEADLARSKKEKQQADFMTAFFNSFQSIRDSLFGSFAKGILAPWTDALGKFDADKFITSFKSLEPTFESLGKSIGSFMQYFVAGGRLEAMVNAFIWTFKTASGIFDGFVKIVSIFTNGLTTLNNAIESVANFLGGKKGENSIPGAIGKFVTTLTTAAVAIGLVWGGKKLWDMAMKALGFEKKNVTIMGGQINIIGGSGGGGDLLDDLLGGEGKGKGRKGKGGLLKRAKRLFRGKGAVGAIEAGVDEVGQIRNLLRSAPHLAKDARFMNLAKAAGIAEEFAPKAGILSKAGGMIGKVAGGAGGLLSKISPGVVEGVGGVAKGLGKKLPLIGAGITAALAAGSAFDIYNQMKAGKISPEDAKKGLFKLGGSVGGGAVGTMIGGALGTLIPIPGVGTLLGAAAGGWIGEKVGGWLGDKASNMKLPKIGVGTALGAAGMMVPGVGAMGLMAGQAFDNKPGNGAGAVAGAAAATAAAASTTVVDSKPKTSEVAEQAGDLRPLLNELRRIGDTLDKILQTEQYVGREQINRLTKLNNSQ